MRIPFRVVWAQSWIGVRILANHLGWWRAIRLGLSADRAVRRGEPFEMLSPPSNEKEAMSRSQIAPAIVLYRYLKAQAGVDAMAVLRDVVLKSTVPWMRFAIGIIDRQRYLEASPGERRNMLEERTTRFFNMEIDGIEAEKDFAFFQVKSCSFPGLCAEAGVPEIAPIFCEVDAYFFGGVQRDLVLERPTTLAEGGDGCPFRFHWAPEGSESLKE
jgi:hypothetical protein